MNTPHMNHRHQSGVVLVIALVLLVVIGFSSAFILRGTLYGDLISNNTKANQQAQLAAETALRYCEQLVVNPVAGLIGAANIIPETDDAGGQAIAWQTQANWNPPVVITAPVAAMQDGTNAIAAQYNNRPQCLIERLPIRIQDENGLRKFGFQITARGFSPDYARAANGDIRSGAETILQLVLRMEGCSSLLGQADCDS